MLQTRIILLLIFSEVLLEEKHNGLNLHFQQNDYKLTMAHTILVRSNRQYFEQCNVVSFKYNRTTTALNFTMRFKQDLGKNVEIIVQAYRFASNEYRQFPLRFQFNYCAGIATNAFGGADILRCGNFTGCPLRKGITYRLCNWAIDESKFPPYIPNGKYMIEVQPMFHDTELLMARTHLEVTRPIPWT